MYEFQLVIAVIEGAQVDSNHESKEECKSNAPLAPLNIYLVF